MNFQRKLCSTSMLIAAWYAAPAAADLQIYSASLLSNTLYIDGREFTPPSASIEPLIQLNGSTLQVLQKSDDHLEARVPSGFQLSPGVSYQLYVSSLGDPSRFGSLTKDQDLNTHSASLALVAPSGATGAKGATGATGAAGAKGATGATGAAGTAGAKGATGAPGAQGIQGIQGLKGATGATGAQGLPGEVGPAGAIGPQGPQGPAGPQGMQGLKGDTGVAGPQGPVGPQGVPGEAGPAGVAGATGATGPGVPTGGTAGQVLAKVDGTDFNTQWTTPAAGGGGGASVQLRANKVGGSGESCPVAVSTTATTVAFNNVVTAPSNGNTWNGNTFTVGADQGGLYMVQARVHTPDHPTTATSTVGVALAFSINNTPYSPYSDSNIYGPYPTQNSNTIPGTKGKGELSSLVQLAAGNSLTVLCIGANSSTAAQPLAADGGSNITIVKMN